MSDEALEAINQLKVKAGDLVRFLAATRKNKTCFQCGEEKWVLHTDPGQQQSNPDPSTGDNQKVNLDGDIIIFELSLADRPEFQPAAMLHCASCGTMTLINYSILRKWVAENPDKIETE